MAIHLTTVFIGDWDELGQWLSDLKLRLCPHCRQAGYLICNGRAYGYAKEGSNQVVRSQRIICSRRTSRGEGCGHTMRVVLSTLVHASIVSVQTLWDCFNSPQKPEWRHWWRRLQGAHSYLRSWLVRVKPPPDLKAGGDCEAETLAHLRAVFPVATCPIAAFQLHFQRCFFPALKS